MNECKRVDAILSELDACTEIIPLACHPTDASSMLGEVIRLDSSTFDAPRGVRILAARRTVLQHGGTITLDQTSPLKKMVSLTLPLYHGQKP